MDLVMARRPSSAVGAIRYSIGEPALRRRVGALYELLDDSPSRTDDNFWNSAQTLVILQQRSESKNERCDNPRATHRNLLRPGKYVRDANGLGQLATVRSATA